MNYKLFNIYKYYLDGILINDELLKNLEITSEEIENWLKYKYLVKLDNGTYIVNNREYLYRYARFLLEVKDFARADICFTKLLEMNADDFIIKLEKFRLRIRLQQYENAYAILKDIIKNNKFPNLQKEYDIYLYLVSFLVPLDEEDFAYIQKLTSQDIFNNSRNFWYKKNIIISIFNQDFREAIIGIGNLKKKYQENMDTIILRCLLIEVLDKKRDRINYEEEFIKQKRFKEAKDAILETASKHLLSKRENMYLHLIDLLESIIKTKQVPLIKDGKYQDKYEALNNNNFAAALKIMEDKSIRNKFDLQDNTFYNFVKYIYGIILRIEENNNHFLIEKDVIIRIVNYLQDNDFYKALEEIRIYLNSLELCNYDYLVCQKIKKDIQEKNKDFTLTVNLLLQLGTGKFSEIEEEIIVDKENIFFKAIDREFARSKVDSQIHKEDTLAKSYQCLYNLIPMIKERGMLIINPQNKKSNNRIHRLMENVSHIDSFSIDNDNDLRVVLKYGVLKEEYIDYYALNDAADLAFLFNDLDFYLEMYRQIFAYGFINSKIVNRIAHIYLQKEDMVTALDYYVLARWLARKEDNYNKYEMIGRTLFGLQNALGVTDNSILWSTILGEAEYYQLPYQEEIRKLLEKDGNLRNIDSLPLRMVDKQMLMLMLAKYYYQQGDEITGDLYLQEVDDMPIKSLMVQSIEQEIKENKESYLQSDVKENLESLMQSRILKRKE